MGSSYQSMWRLKAKTRSNTMRMERRRWGNVVVLQVNKHGYLDYYNLYRKTSQSNGKRDKE
jgi:hypothetical protein